MKQLLQNLSSGETILVEAPAPMPSKGQVLIDTTHSLVSLGTERMLVEFGQAGLLSKARKQPDKVKQVLEKMAVDGVVSTLEAVRSKLNVPLPLGYCNVGRVRASGVTGLVAGQRVVSNGPHASVVSVAGNLCAPIPDSVSDEAAAFTVVASIGLQGIRLAQPTLGEAFVVTGVGLIGLLTVQLLRAHGCRVMAVDFDPAKLELARRFGAETCNPGAGEDPVAAGLTFSRGAGVDGVIVTASTKSSDPITQAARMCRKRGRIVLVGVTGLTLNRADFYEKELRFQVSCSYGPGRYDPTYEDQGHDYPLPFVRWTEQRNFEAVLDMMAAGALDTAPLVSRRVPFEEAPQTYADLSGDTMSLGIILTYESPTEARHAATVVLQSKAVTTAPKAETPVVGFIGAGNYASRMLIPAFRAAGADLRSIASAGGTNATVHGTRAGFAQATSDTAGLITDPAINVAVIVTRHNSHARLVVEALEAGKHVFVEKPLALTLTDLDSVETAYATAGGRHLMVGFNRRFAPLVVKMKALMDSVHGPKSLISVMNAGAVPAHHWTQASEVGGGRILGEACHHIDLLRHLAGAPITSVQVRRMEEPDNPEAPQDKAVIVLGFADGSMGTVHYLANGGAAFPKERVEVFAAGRSLQLNNFLRLKGYNWPGFKRQALWRQDKGQAACAAAFLNAVSKGTGAPIPAPELFEVARVSIEATEMLRAQGTGRNP